MCIEKQVYNFIVTNHVGKENMVKNRQLRVYFPQIKSDKAMRKIIENIMFNPDFKYFIGSVSGSKGGYYACTLKSEIQETKNSYMHRAMQMLENSKKFESKEVIEYAER